VKSVNGNSTTQPLDAGTVTAIREALDAAQLGRVAEACETAERALANGGEVVALNALLGMLRARAGDPDGAIRHLRLARDARPSDIKIATNLASALIDKEDYEAALAIATEKLASSDGTRGLLRLRAYAAQMSGDADTAVRAYENLVDADPGDWEVLNNLGNARVLAGDFEGGISALRQSLKINPLAAPTRLNLSRSLRQLGEYDEAEKHLLQIAEDFPDDVKALIDLHDLLKETGREDEEVLKVLIRAARREPRNLSILLALGRQHGLMLRYSASEKTFRKALEVDPSNGEAFIALATLDDHKDAAALDALAVEAEAAKVEPNALNLIRALADRRAKRDREGLEALTRVADDFEPERREELLGAFHDRLGNYDEAFAAFTRMNDSQANDQSRPLHRAALIRNEVRDRIASTSRDWAHEWTAAPTTDTGRPAPIFLLGFPRSGTTLLDTMLMGHPDVEVMEERPPIADVSKSLGTMSEIAGLGAEDLRNARQRYFREASDYVPVRERTRLIDKSPLHLNNVQFIHRLFPEAHYILALRHPADSVLSCFVSSFRLNPSMSNFLRLDTAAEFYDLAFTNWEAARAIFPLKVHTIRYEDLVEKTEEELRKVTDAVGLSWDDRLLEHQSTAATRGVIPTASYAQVTEPIYRRSVDRWRNYRKHLEPILPTLKPWIDKFGYSL
jgi:tetratricopeptide (TPR) repeat protein